MQKLEFSLTFLAGLVVGVLVTRFVYGAAMNIATALLILAAIALIVIVFKLKHHKKQSSKN